MNNGIFGFPKQRSNNLGVEAWLLDTRNAIRVDEYTVAGTYSRISAPCGANYLTILAYGGGGGGQGGEARLAGTVAGGGGGGGGGGTALVSVNLKLLPDYFRIQQYVLRVVVGAGGAGGAARNTTGAGNGGTDGGSTSVTITTGGDTVIGRLAFAQLGKAGSGSPGQRNGVGGAGQNMGMMSYSGSGTLNYHRGQTGGLTAGWASGGARFPVQFDIVNPTNIPLHPYICGGGGSGGVVNTDGTSQAAGGSGGTGFYFYEPLRAADGGTGAGADATLSDIVFAGVGGNGGYSAIVSQAVNAYNGGAGIRGGGGGGGGGIIMSASPGTYSSGAGGAGGAGYCLLIWEP